MGAIFSKLENLRPKPKPKVQPILRPDTPRPKDLSPMLTINDVPPM